METEEIIVQGTVPSEHLPVVDGKVVFLAPRAADVRTGYSGQGYVFSSEEQAFEGTPNRGTATVYPNGRFTVVLRETPSAYHAGFGRDIEAPRVVVMYMDRSRTLRVTELPLPPGGGPNKPLGHDPERVSPEYYVRRSREELPQVWYGDVRDGARTQEEILRSKVTTRTASQSSPVRHQPTPPQIA